MLGAVDLALVQSGAKAHEDVVVLLGVLGQDDVGAGEGDLVGVVGVGAEDEVVVAELLLEGDGVGRPGGGGVDLAGDEGRRHAGDVHLDGVDVVDGEAGVLEHVLEDDLGGGAGGDAHRLAGEVSAGLDAVGLVGDDAVGLGELVEGEDLGLALDAQGVRAVADLGDVHGAGLHGRDLGGAGLELLGLDGDADLLEVALVDGREERGGGAQVGHEGNVDGDGLVLGAGRLLAALVGGVVSSGLLGAVIAAGEDHAGTHDAGGAGDLEEGAAAELVHVDLLHIVSFLLEASSSSLPSLSRRGARPASSCAVPTYLRTERYSW